MLDKVKYPVIPCKGSHRTAYTAFKPKDKHWYHLFDLKHPRAVLEPSFGII